MGVSLSEVLSEEGKKPSTNKDKTETKQESQINRSIGRAQARKREQVQAASDPAVSTID
jgi:hypothetical protein